MKIGKLIDKTLNVMLSIAFVVVVTQTVYEHWAFQKDPSNYTVLFLLSLLIV